MRHAPYEGYASLYDRQGQSRFSLRMVGYAREIWDLNGARVDRVLELACGTGAAAVALARRGYDVTGVDRSPAMLGQARGRAARWGATVRWLEQDLRELEAGGGFDAATCFYDSFNYFLVPSDLIRCFERIRRELVPGGLLLFDAISDHGISSVWGNEIDLKLGDDVARIWKASYDPSSCVGTLETEYFVREPDERYRRIREVHRHRGYSRLEVFDALAAAGLEPVSAHPCLTFEVVRPSSYRVAYLARRPQRG